MKRSRWIDWLVAGGALSLQSGLTWAFQSGRLGYAGLSFGSSLAFAIPIIASDVTWVLPIVANLKRRPTKTGEVLLLRATYAALAFLSCLTGAYAVQFFRWVFAVYQALFASFLASAPIVAGGESDPETAFAIIDSLLPFFMESPHREILILALAAPGAVTLLRRVTRERGPRAALYSAYKSHRSKFFLRRQERRFELIAFAFGFSLTFYLSTLYFLLALLRGSTFASLDQWLAGKPSSTLANLESRWGAACYGTFQTYAYVSPLVLPMLDTGDVFQVGFAALLITPFVTAILVDLAAHRHPDRSLRLSPYLLVGFSSACLLGAGALLFTHPTSNPIVAVLAESLGASELQVDQPILLEAVHQFLSFASCIGISFGISMAIAKWIDPFDETWAQRDPFRGLYHQKAMLFVDSLILRGAVALFLVFSTQSGSDLGLISDAPAMVASVVFIVGAMMFDADDLAEQPKEFKELYSARDLERSMRKWKKKLECLIDARNMTNYLLLIVLGLLSVGTASGAAGTALLFGIPFGFFFYAMRAATEAAVLEEYVDVRLDLKSVFGSLDP